MKAVQTQLEIRANWEKNVIRHPSGLVNTLTMPRLLRPLRIAVLFCKTSGSTRKATGSENLF